MTVSEGGKTRHGSEGGVLRGGGRKHANWGGTQATGQDKGGVGNSVTMRWYDGCLGLNCGLECSGLGNTAARNAGSN